MTSLQKSLPVRRLLKATMLRDGVLGLTLGFIVLLTVALACFTPPVLAGMGVNTEILSFMWSNMTTDTLREKVCFIAPDVGLSFTPPEAAHLADVRNLLHSAAWACGGLTLLFIAGGLLRPNWQRITLAAFGAIALLAATVTGLWLGADFQAVSNIFHNAFFPSGNWQFAPHQLMITLYPPVVMQTGMQLWLGVSLLVSGVIALISWHKNKA